MTRNMGPTDRLLRGVLAAPPLLVAALIVGVSTAAGILLVVAAVVMLATAATGFCPLYRLLHVDTRRRARQH